MDIKETGKKLKPFAPVLSVALVTACVAGSLSGYEAPVYAATQEETPAKKEETKEKKEEKKTVAKGTFDLEDGVYKGTGTGYAGDITASVLIKDKQIVSIDILSSSDDAAFFTRAKAVLDKIIEGQTLDVDTVSGATFSSRGIISAVKNALTGEKDTSKTGQAQSGQTGAAAGSSTSVAQVEDAAAYKDGTYYGSGTGFGGPLKVMVEISGGKIASIQIVENSDGSDYISKAGKTTINVQLPDGFDPEYSVDGLDVSVEGNVLTFKAATESRAAASVKPGKYTLTIKDKNKKYADVVTTFTLTTKDMPAAYDEENKKLVEAEGFNTDALKAYLGNITSVNVNGKDYAASGRGSVVIINKDGTIKTDADPFKDAVAGTEFQITVASTGYTTPLTFTYKIAETPAPAEVDTTALEAAIAEADNLKEADYTADSWAAYQAALQNARTVLEAKESQEAVNQALSTLNAAKDALVKAEEEPVAINTASLEKAIADAKALKEADYTAESWKALQSALSDARKALEAKESQEAVDNATNRLNKAIKALVKKGSSSVKKTDGTTNGSKTSGSDSVKTGDPASVLGWIGLAVSSLGAGMGGFAWKRRKRK